jgi:hypothetical protein
MDRSLGAGLADVGVHAARTEGPTGALGQCQHGARSYSVAGLGLPRPPGTGWDRPVYEVRLTAEVPAGRRRTDQPRTRRRRPGVRGARAPIPGCRAARCLPRRPGGRRCRCCPGRLRWALRRALPLSRRCAGPPASRIVANEAGETDGARPYAAPACRTRLGRRAARCRASSSETEVLRPRRAGRSWPPAARDEDHRHRRSLPLELSETETAGDARVARGHGQVSNLRR